MEAKATEKKIIISNEMSAVTKQALVNFGYLVANIILLSLLVNLCIRIDTIYLDLNISEFSVTEFTQSVLLVTSSLLFFLIARKNVNIQHAALLISGFFAVLAIRELDHFFDMIHHGSWKIPAFLASAFAITKAVKAGKKTLIQLAFFIETPFFKQMVSSVILLLVFSRIYGMGSFWQEIMDVNYIREVKNISEEGIELLFYSLICFSAFKVFQYLKK